MPTKTIISIAILLILLGAISWFYYSQQRPTITENFILDAKNCVYDIDGDIITLENGYSEREVAPGSASKKITRYFGNEAVGDFNNDGIGDTAFILTQNSGGSGTFYYLVAAVSGNNTCNGTNAILLGDRIAPQTTESDGNMIIVNYAGRKPGEPMSTSPSVGVTKRFSVEGITLRDITPEK